MSLASWALQTQHSLALMTPHNIAKCTAILLRLLCSGAWGGGGGGAMLRVLNGWKMGSIWKNSPGHNSGG